MTEVEPHKELVTQNEIVEKLWTSWRLSRRFTSLHASENYKGAPNWAISLRFFYESLYNPEYFDDELCAKYGLNERDKGVLSKGLSSRAKIKQDPDKKKFTQRLSHLLTSEVPYNNALFEDSLDAVEKLLEFGYVYIWTTGDVEGFPSLNALGSREQMKKMARAGLGRLKREYPKRMSYLAHEDKFESLARELPVMQRNETNHVVVIDDKLDNLLEARKVISESEIEVSLIWDLESTRQETVGYKRPKMSKRYATLGTYDEVANRYGITTINSLNQVVEFYEGKFKSDDRVTFLIDYDDVISDDNKRVNLQQSIILDYLFNRLS